MTVTAYPDVLNTPESAGDFVQATMKDAERIGAGVGVSLDSNGEAVNAGDTSGDTFLGRSEESVDNTGDGKKIKVKRGAFWFANNGNITAAHIGSQATVVDNSTVGLAADTTNDVVAGRILNVDAELGVLVDSRLNF